MSLKLSFPSGTFKNTGEAFTFVYPFLRFSTKVAHALTSRRDGIWLNENNTAELIANLANNNDDYFDLHDGDSLEALGDEGVSFVVYRKKAYYHMELFAIEAATPEKVDITGLIVAAAALGFTTAIYADDEKGRWQSERFTQHYETAGRPHAHLPKINYPGLSETYGPLVDISQNPGHQIPTYNMYLMAAPEIWFGPGSRTWFDHEQVKRFDGALSINEPTPDVVYVHLFDRAAADYEAPEILALQQRFRTWVKMDEVTALLNSKLTTQE